MPLPRHLQPRLLQAIEQFPIVTLTGPRQSGKTTLARHALRGYEYVSLEGPDQRRLAYDDGDCREGHCVRNAHAESERMVH